MKRKIFPILQLALGLGIILLLFYRMHARGVLDELAGAFGQAAGNWPLLLVAFSLFGVCIVAAVYRWSLILSAQGYSLSDGKITTLFFVGHFFNAFLLGATGGDLVKAYYAATETHHKRTEMVSSIFIDRMLGLLALVALTVVVMACRLPFFLRYPATRIALLFNAGLLLVIVLALAVVFRRDVFEHWSFFARMERTTSVGAQISRIYRSFRFCLHRPRLLTATLLISLANHVAGLASAFYVGMALGLDLGFMDYVTMFLIINAVATIPLTPSGLGTRETACIFLMGVLGVPEPTAMSLSLLVYGSAMLWSLIGGVVYLFYSARRGRVSELVLEPDGPPVHDPDAAS